MDHGVRYQDAKRGDVVKGVMRCYVLCSVAGLFSRHKINIGQPDSVKKIVTNLCSNFWCLMNKK